jgi:transposase
MPDELWNKLEPLLPPRPTHPLGCHNPRVPDRSAIDAILLVLRTGMQWQALKATGLCHPSSAYRRFREWLAAGVFHRFWQLGLMAYDKLEGIVATDAGVIQFHRNHRGPEDHPVISGRFFAQADSA